MTTAEIQVVRDAEQIEMRMLEAGDAEGAAALRSLIDGYCDGMRQRGAVVASRQTTATSMLLAALVA